jgi:hypothetical protein
MIKFIVDPIKKAYSFLKTKVVCKVNENFMKKVTKALAYAKGKKTTAMAILALLVTYAMSKNYIDIDMAILLNGIFVVIGFGANYATTKLVK